MSRFFWSVSKTAQQLFCLCANGIKVDGRTQDIWITNRTQKCIDGEMRNCDNIWTIHLTCAVVYIVIVIYLWTPNPACWCICWRFCLCMHAYAYVYIRARSPTYISFACDGVIPCTVARLERWHTSHSFGLVVRRLLNVSQTGSKTHTRAFTHTHTKVPNNTNVLALNQQMYQTIWIYVYGVRYALFKLEH